MKRFVVKFENGNEPFYLADWDGDPGRTLLIENAKKFLRHKSAQKALEKAITDHPLRKLVGEIIPL